MTLLEHQKLLENLKLPQRNKSNQAWAKAVIWGAIIQLLKSLIIIHKTFKKQIIFRSTVAPESIEHVPEVSSNSETGKSVCETSTNSYKDPQVAQDQYKNDAAMNGNIFYYCTIKT